MKYQTIEEVYAANDKIRVKFLETIESISDEQANALPEGEKWTLAQLVEHVAIVEDGMTKISYKLLNEAKAGGKASDGTAKFSDSFSQNAAEARNQKLEAPNRVKPSGNVSIADSVKRLEENRQKLDELKPLFETIDCSEHKFPHPAFGDLTAHEWLALVGGHESRHLEQIKRRLA
jgi:uncharacterized damage-inducible protein DinB